MQIGKKILPFKFYLALAVFVGYWLLVFSYILFEKKLQKKIPNISWAYHQTFPQSWSFFTQPAIYNDKLLIVLKDSNNNIYDSIDVLQELWNRKRSKFNYAKESVWDHIMFRQVVHCRTAIGNKDLCSYTLNNATQNNTYFKQINNPRNQQFIYNLEVFSKEMLKEKKYVVKSSSQFQLQLITNYTQPFYKHTTAHAAGNEVWFITHWKKY